MSGDNDNQPELPIPDKPSLSKPGGHINQETNPGFFATCWASFAEAFPIVKPWPAWIRGEVAGMRKGWLLFLFLLAISIYATFRVTVVVITQRLTSEFDYQDLPARIVDNTQTFTDTEIDLDDHAYIGCVFNNVTVRFDGTRGFSIVNCRFQNCYLKLMKKNMGATVQLLQSLNMLPHTLLYGPNGLIAIKDFNAP